jgi:hypothetical protein
MDGPIPTYGDIVDDIREAVCELAQDCAHADLKQWGMVTMPDDVEPTERSFEAFNAFMSSISQSADEWFDEFMGAYTNYTLDQPDKTQLWLRIVMDSK